MEVEVASLAFGAYGLLHSRSERHFGSQGATWPGSAVSKMKASLEQLITSNSEYLRKKNSRCGPALAFLLFLSLRSLLHREIPAPLGSVLQGSFVPACFSVLRR